MVERRAEPRVDEGRTAPTVDERGVDEGAVGERALDGATNDGTAVDGATDDGGMDDGGRFDQYTDDDDCGLVRIADPDDSRLHDYRDLTDIASRRRIEGDELFIAEGPVAIERLMASPHRIRSVLVTERKYERLAARLDHLTAPVYVTDRDTMRRIVGFDLHRGAIAAADRRPHLALDELARQASRIVVLEGLNDPENLGAIARSARALGVDGLVLDPTCIDPYTRRTVRVSMGEILHVPVCRTTKSTWPGALAALHHAGFETWALTPRADADDIWSLEVPRRLALILGPEGPGLPVSTLDTATRRVRLPIHDDVDSLNVGAAAAVAFAVVARPG